MHLGTHTLRLSRWWVACTGAAEAWRGDSHVFGSRLLGRAIAVPLAFAWGLWLGPLSVDLEVVGPP